MRTKTTSVIPCIHADVDVEALLEMFDAIGAQSAGLDWDKTVKLSTAGVSVQVEHQALAIEARDEPWRKPRISLSRNDDAIGDAPPYVLIASWQASLAASVHKETPEALSVMANLGHAAELLVAAGIAAERTDIHAIACSNSSSTNNHRFFLSDVDGPLKIMPKTLAWVECAAPRFRMLGWGLRMISTHEIVGDRRSASDLDALQTLRLIAAVPRGVIDEVRAAPHLS